VYRRLKADNLGLNLLIHCSNVATGLAAASALARECHLKARVSDYRVVSASDSDSRVMDPLTQKKMYPMDFVFAAATGAAAMTLFLDHEGMVGGNADDDGRRGYSAGVDGQRLNADLLSHLRTHQGFFCLVTPVPLRGVLPVEFSLYLDLEHPSEEAQMQAWEKHLKKSELSDDDLVTLVEESPMHVGEIDFIAGRVRMESILRAQSGTYTLELIRTVIARYRRKSAIPMLFGPPVTTIQAPQPPPPPPPRQQLQPRPWPGSNQKKPKRTSRTKDSIPF